MSTEILRKSDLDHWLPVTAPGIRYGISRLTRPISMDFYDQWISEKHHADMDYLVRHRDVKEEIQRWLPFARSAIVFAIDYVTKPLPESSKLRTALYAQFAPKMADYHSELKQRLEPTLAALKVRYPKHEFRFSVDSEPILERDLAVRAGLGWVGKNTCVIDKNGGSLFFIAEILTSLEVETASVISADHCGTCTRCLEICPTGALKEPRVLDAGRCISYWTIESKKIPSLGLRQGFQDWFFGCDLCQTVCPWNGKVWGKDLMNKMTNPSNNPMDRESLILELKQILESSNRELQRHYKDTPLARARGSGLKRNALIVIENRELHELQPVVEAIVAHHSTTQELKQLASDVLLKIRR
ncbi:MAG: tRNA epoxyqueuosine(34) reductase QueG [Deltaproteobacteria bacterium]|nr:tRNA epoxyqueuosine(34) reductase QueG [Deltaproteobacteria bacterium]